MRGQPLSLSLEALGVLQFYMSEDSIEQLTKHFATMGAHDPEGWARSQVQEGIPQWARFVFLRQLGLGLVKQGDATWIDQRLAAEAKYRHIPDKIGPAVARMRAVGVSSQDLTEVVRAMQAELLFHFCSVVDDCGSVDYPNSDMPRVEWALAQTNEEGEAVGVIDALHESISEVISDGHEPPTGPHT